MKLVIDAGNTNTKVGLFEKDDLKEVFIYQTHSKLSVPFNQVNAAIISTVNNKELGLIDELKSAKVPIHFLTSNTKLPFSTNYENTLGTDRIANVAAGLALSGGSPTLLISVGTCITYDFLDSNSNHQGVGISPGPVMRLKAMNTFTSRLPLVASDKPFNFPSSTTDENLLIGAIMGSALEIDGFIQLYLEKHPDLKVFLTGGDAKLLATYIKTKIFALPNLTLIGLNKILDTLI